MTSNRMTEGVGKKIVEALKQQSDIEIIPVKDTSSSPELTNMSSLEPKNNLIDEMILPNENEEIMKNTNMNTTNTFNHSNQFNEVENAFNNTMMNFQTPESNIPPIEEMELPTNVAVLRQLISKLPSNVSKQIGAMIIKQTMEALGISMTNVLQEAQQVQENLTQSVRECQTSVLEHKKQINILEVQAQKYQRQFAAVNDIISLFIQTNN